MDSTDSNGSPKAIRQRLLRDIDTLRTSINHDWKDLASMNLPRQERDGIKVHLKWCLQEMQMLLLKLEQAEAVDDIKGK